MSQYFKILFADIWKGSFWIARWETFLDLVRDPGAFYAEVGKKDWDKNAFLFGLSLGLAQIFIFVAVFSGLLGVLLGAAGFWSFVLGFGIGLAGWFFGALFLYYIVSWLFAKALQWIAGKNEKDKIRPILFTLWPAGLLGIIPGIGGLLTLAAFLVLLVIAYEKALRVERSPAVGASLLGLVLTGVAAWIPGLILGWGFISLATGFAAHNAAQAGIGWEKPKSEFIGLPDKWPILESFHRRSDSQKLADAVEVIRQEIGQALAENTDAGENATPALIELYGDLDQVPTDAYRLAIQNVLQQDQTGGGKNDGIIGQVFFTQVLEDYYDKGKGPATVKIAAIEAEKRPAQAKADTTEAALALVKSMMQGQQAK
jgi:hypothetical protein